MMSYFLFNSGLSAGAKRLCLVAAPELKVFAEYQVVTLLATLSALYVARHTYTPTPIHTPTPTLPHT